MKEIKIELQAMRFYASHGCYATEKQVGGRFEVTLSYTYNAQSVVETDDVGCAVNYLDVYDEVSRQMSVSSNTIEHVGGRICTALLDRCQAIERVEVTVTKLAPPLGGDIARVSATVNDHRSGHPNDKRSDKRSGQ